MMTSQDSLIVKFGGRIDATELISCIEKELQKLEYQKESYDQALERMKKHSLQAIQQPNPIKKNRTIYFQSNQDLFDNYIPKDITLLTDKLSPGMESTKAYITMMFQIIAMNDDKLVTHESPLFLEFIISCIRPMRRFWKQLAVDIRKGKLHKELNVTHEVRIEVDLKLTANPELALQLDDVFRHVGFYNETRNAAAVQLHKQPFAQRKLPKHTPLDSQAVDSCDLSVQCYSLPAPRSDLLASGLLQKDIDAISDPGDLSSCSQSLAPLALGEDGFSQYSPARSQKSKLKGKNVQSKSLSKKEKEVATYEDNLVEFERRQRKAQEMDKLQTRLGLQRVKLNLNTNSLSKLDDYSVSTTSLQRLAHKFASQPQVRYNRVLLVDGTYLCPFPLCGREFQHREVAFAHLAA